jgi:hypothetical protein
MNTGVLCYNYGVGKVFSHPTDPYQNTIHVGGEQQMTEQEFTTEELANEEWLAVSGFETHYEVSNLGRVRCWVAGGGRRRRQPRIKAIGKDKDGYSFIVLFCKGRRMKGYRVSRLVLLTFRPSSNASTLEASHKNNIRTDNRLTNLTWETRQENEDRKRTHGTRPLGENNTASKLSSKDVIAIKQLTIVRGDKRKLAKQYGISESAMGQIINGGTWKHLS